jgi:hypothetical protein
MGRDQMADDADRRMLLDDCPQHLTRSISEIDRAHHDQLWRQREGSSGIALRTFRLSFQFFPIRVIELVHA